MRAYNNPGAWWGWHGWQNRPQPMSITQIIAAGSMSSELAALLWLLLHNGRSIVVSSLPQRAGKTTTLTALTSFIPDSALAYFSQGIADSFAVPPLEKECATYLMINEISDHLPIYTWGDGALRALSLLEEGYSLAATVHARDAQETIALLEHGLGAPPRHLAHLDCVLSLRLSVHGHAAKRQVSEFTLVRPRGDGYRIEVVGTRAPFDPQFELLPGAIAEVGALLGRDAGAVEQETSKRKAFLDDLVAREIYDAADVNAAIRSFRSGGGS